MMTNKADYAKKLLRHYFLLVARMAGGDLEDDCMVEIDAIVDRIIATARDEMPAPPTTKPAPLQVDPAMTLGAATEPDAPLLGVLLEDGKWAALITGQVHNGYNPYVAAMIAENYDGEVVDVKEHFGPMYSIRDSQR